MTNFAPGIPERRIQNLPEDTGQWTVTVQDHTADRAGPHWDLRLVDKKTGQAHSWAIPKRSFPEPGKIRLAVQQPTHTADYANWEGRIESGYGKGDVKLIHSSPTQVKSSPDRIEFTHPELGTIILRRKDTVNWIMIKPKMEKIAQIPDTKPKFKLTPWDNLTPDNDTIWQAKLDGAFMYYTLGADGVKAFSYRRSKKTGEAIEHTKKLVGFDTAKVPEELHGTVLMGEAYHPDLALGEVGGILNSVNKPISTKLRPAIHGVLRLPDKDVSSMSNWEKLDILKDIAKRVPVFDLPDTARTLDEKTRLITKIRAGVHGQTSEGIIEYPERGIPRKSPITPTDDFPITGTTPGTGKFKDLGIGSLLVGDNKIRVGTGLSDPLRKVLHENPELAKGLVARVAAKEQFRSGKLRTAAFKGFHPEKSDPEAYGRIISLLDPKSVKTASITDIARVPSSLPSLLSRIPNIPDALISLASKLPVGTQRQLSEALPVAMEKWSTTGMTDPSVLTFIKTLLMEAFLDPAMDILTESRAFKALKNMTPSGRMSNSLQELHRELPQLGFDKISNLLAEIRELSKTAGTEDIGNLSGGAIVGAATGALAGKGAKQKMWGLLIGGGIGGYAGMGAKRTEPTFEPNNPIPSYMLGNQGH